jgi:hypothetical protein
MNGDGGKSIWVKGSIVVVGLLVVASLVIMVLNYRFPAFFNVETGKAKPGVVFNQTLITITEQMADRWLPNDKFYPTIFLDNPQNFQLGQLEAVRYTTRVMRDKLSRLRTTDKIDPDAENAFVFFSNDPKKWILPSAESKFRNGVDSLKRYGARLETGEASFHPRADNLNELIDQYVSIMGGVNTRLSNAVGHKKGMLSEETSGDQYSEGEKMVQVRVPWTQVDDNFYYAQGVAYVLRQMMMAIRYEFKNIIEIKKADELVGRTVQLLGDSQFEPLLVLNGDRGAITANHSLQLQSLLEDARQKMRSFQDMLRD